VEYVISALCFMIDIILQMHVLLQYARYTVLLLQRSRLLETQKPNYIRYKYGLLLTLS